MSETLGVDPGTGFSGYGTTVQGATTGVVGMLLKVNIEGAECGEIDVTTMNSTAGWMVFIANMKDAKEISLDLIFEKVNAGALNTNFALANETWTITFPDGCTYVQSGYIKKVGTQIPHNDKITQSCTLRMSGPPTFTQGSGANEELDKGSMVGVVPTRRVSGKGAYDIVREAVERARAKNNSASVKVPDQKEAPAEAVGV